MTDTPNILSDPPSEKFEEFRTIINHTTDHGKLENIHSAVNLELGFRLSLPGTYENPDLRDLKPNELVLISKDVVRRMVELIQRQKDLNGELNSRLIEEEDFERYREYALEDEYLDARNTPHPDDWEGDVDD